MFKIFIFILSPVIIIITLYQFITNDFELQPLVMLLLSFLMLVLGLEHFRITNKLIGWFLIAVFLFTLFVSIQGFVLN
ncbi:hypothetical protein GCM10008983_27990 [Lentibacillus halophilus]|uniref:DUF3953 domain-containing protein n=1 Tax=Lentibacillus halophilus TaxID=295065 RepID=A0ABP3JC11_9BACI